MELADSMNFVGSTFFKGWTTFSSHLSSWREWKQTLGQYSNMVIVTRVKAKLDGEMEIKVIWFHLSLFLSYISWIPFCRGSGDIWRFSALVLYPPDKRCAGDAGRPAPDNWGINSSGLSCKELSHRPTKISIPMRNTLSKDRFFRIWGYFIPLFTTVTNILELNSS